MTRISEICKININFVLALTGFDITIMAIILTSKIAWNWAFEAASILIAVSVSSLTFSFFVYHTILAEELDIKNPGNAVELIRKGNMWAEIGLFCLISIVPILLWESTYHIAFIASLIGLLWIVYRFKKGRI